LKSDDRVCFSKRTPTGVTVRVHDKGNLGAKPRSEAIAEILLSIKERHD